MGEPLYLAHYASFAQFVLPGTLLANVHARKDHLPVQQTAWYIKKLPTFSDALTTVKQDLYSYLYFRTSPIPNDVRKSPPIRSHYRYSRSTHAFFQVSYG